MSETTTTGPTLDDVVYRLGSDERWMVGQRDNGRTLVLRERGDTSGPWLRLDVRQGDTFVEPVDLVRGALSQHQIKRPGCTCGECPASRWTCSCGFLQAWDEAAARQHVAEHIVALLDL